MFGRIAKYLTFSNVIACLALFVALGGSVYAAGKISGKQIRPSSLPGNRIKPKTLPPNRIKPNSLGSTQINEQSLTGVSAASLADVQYQAATGKLAIAKPTTITANCGPGAYAIGGGATVSDDQRASVNDSGPSPLRTGWTATGYSWSFGGPEMTVTAVCVLVQKPGGAVNTVTGESPPGGPVYEPGG